MKKFLLPMVVMLGLSTSTMASAAETLKVGVIDLNRVLQTAPLMTSINTALTDKFKSRQDEIANANKQLLEESNRLQYSGDTMSDTDKSKLQNKILSDKANVQILDANFQRDLAMAKTQSMQTFLAKLNSVVKKLAQDGGYDIIEQRNNMLFVDPKLDVTEQVLKQLS